MKGCQAGFVFELGGRKSGLVTTRIGISRFRLQVQGVASHAGTGRRPKSSALLELAHRIIQLESMNTEPRDPKGLMLNVGEARGGKAYNFLPDKAELEFAIRFWKKSTEEKFIQTLTELLKIPSVPGCRSECPFISKRPPLDPTAECRALFVLCQQEAEKLGQSLPEEHRTGGSGASFLLEQGIPVLDGFGPVGDYDFSLDEFVYRESLFERIELLCSCLLRIRQKPLS